MQSKEQDFFFDAIRKGLTEDVIKVLELFPSLLDTADSKGYTPLILAAYNDQPHIVDILLQKGANVDLQDAAGNTALMGACFKGYIEVVKRLLHAGADVNLRNHQGAPALTFAATFGQLAIAELLLSHGAHIDLKDSRGKSSYDHAVLQENNLLINLFEQYK